ncbi:MAG TPA: pseudouridine-5'-phosphate glycosidase [Halanaerobiales bacterium]|nr:pseudouridine-5'-phosphate glycosidase [Halanaerobiales bacterium]
MVENFLRYSKEVGKAIKEDQPIVALESTIIAHGFPYPDNIELAIELEEQAREVGVIPATIAIIDGELRVGLTKEEIEFLGQSNNIKKASLRDLPVLVSKKLNGATTVAATMQIAYLAGIDVFVTGGIGGVHRKAEKTFDISADLKALSEFPVTVVCAGAKSVLDLPKTKEVLESKGVPILGYNTEKFPAFYLRDSGLEVDYPVSNGKEVADIMVKNMLLENRNGILVTVPIPKEDELNRAQFNKIIDELIQEVEDKNIRGKDITPYLLARIKEETDGASVKANISLVKNNLKAGCKISQALKEMR